MEPETGVFLSGVLAMLALSAAVGARARTRGRAATAATVGALALLFPATAIAAAYTSAVTYIPAGPNDPGDAPATFFLGILMLSPVVYVVGLVLAGGAYAFGRRFHPDNRGGWFPSPLKLR